MHFATLDLEFLVVDCIPKNMQPDRLSAIPGMLTTLSNNAADQCLQGPGNTLTPYSHNKIHEIEKRQNTSDVGIYRQCRQQSMKR